PARQAEFKSLHHMPFVTNIGRQMVTGPLWNVRLHRAVNSHTRFNCATLFLETWLSADKPCTSSVLLYSGRSVVSGTQMPTPHAAAAITDGIIATAIACRMHVPRRRPREHSIDHLIESRVAIVVASMIAATLPFKALPRGG